MKSKGSMLTAENNNSAVCNKKGLIAFFIVIAIIIIPLGVYALLLCMTTIDKGASKGLSYNLSNDGTYCTVTGINNCADTDIVISSTYSNPIQTGGKTLPVTGIGSYAFRDCISITNITIPDSVTSIGSHAFYGCTSLTRVSI